MWTGISLCDLPEPYRKQAEQKILQQMAKRSQKELKEQKKDTDKKGKTPKMRNQKVERNGIVFDSKREADRYDELLMMQKQGLICELERQKEYVLIPAQYKTEERYGKRGQKLQDKKILLERGVTYVADFVYKKDGEFVVEDSKGYRNPSSAPYAKFVLKRKLMLWVHGIKITEV